MITPQGVQNEGFISLGDLRISEPSLVSQIHLGWHCTSVESRRLSIHFEINCLRRLNADDELIARYVLEYSLCDVLELDANLDLSLVQGYSYICRSISNSKGVV